LCIYIYIYDRANASIYISPSLFFLNNNYVAWLTSDMKVIAKRGDSAIQRGDTNSADQKTLSRIQWKILSRVQQA